MKIIKVALVVITIVIVLLVLVYAYFGGFKRIEFRVEAQGGETLVYDVPNKTIIYRQELLVSK
ncbi:hypothetical protein AGMMS4957_07000 [Bacteroidia bacterium]|nr:hypothetical protein AGMMS4957_07000 [Bacteroidia bacterium]